MQQYQLPKNVVSLPSEKIETHYPKPIKFAHVEHLDSRPVALSFSLHYILVLSIWKYKR